MESKTMKIEDFEIGTILYRFEAVVYYYAGNYSPDPCDGDDSELVRVELGKIDAFNQENDEEWTVTQKAEGEMVQDWFSEVAMDYVSGILN